jgi:RHS repeat-associated protein
LTNSLRALRASKIATRSGLARFRSHSAPIAGAVLFFFVESALAPAMAWAHPDERAAAQSHDDAKAPARPSDEPKAEPAPPEPSDADASGAGVPAALTSLPASSTANSLASKKKSPGGDKKVAAPEPSPPPADLNQALALPTGTDKTGVTSKAISLPQGSGKVQGMGESFSAQLSTGIATFSVPFSLPHARGGAQPALGLSYSSGGGFGLAGVGWDVGVPFIARQTDRGLPNYDDQVGFDPNQDRFVFNGGQELVPICVVSGRACANAPNETMPAWSAGAQYFRPRVEGSFLRFFWSSDHRTWRVQDKSGVTMELGVPLDGSNDRAGLDTNPNDSSQIYRWHLVRQYDSQGDNVHAVNPAGPLVSVTPSNVVVYRYVQSGGAAYLSDIFDTTPQASPATTDTSVFAHHAHLSYEQRGDPTFSYRSGWRMDQTLRLAGVDVTSKAFDQPVTSARHQVRRYHLGYAAQHASLLTSVQVEGRCTTQERDAPAEQSELLPDSTNCAALPAMTFDYSHVTENADLPGFEGFNHDLVTIQSSPPHSVDDALTDLLDIDSDGLPDVLNTAVGTYGYGHGVFFNSAGGKADSFGGANLMTVQGVLGANANTITFQNLNLAPLDLDGDGTINLLHMPQVKTYSTYSPSFQNGAWSWLGHVVSTASGQNPKIDFGKDTTNTKVMDVNGDGLVDVVVSTGTEYQTFLALGRLPAGDGQFGQGHWASASSAGLSNDPIRTCVPWSSTPVQLSDPDVQLADMNGDGLPDIVRVRRGDIRYWPGRGDGVWGTGQRSDCTAGSFSSNGYITMGGPQYSDIQGTTLRMDDVNGDGLDDLVQVRYDAIDIWLNVDGKAWTDRHIIPGTPQSPSYANRVRLVDVNGSGTRDILWGNAKNYQYIDLEGGKKSFLLTHVENGLGKSTDIEYSTSTQEMLAAESLKKCDPTSDAQLLATSPWGCAWSLKMPTVAHVVKRVTESDNLTVAGAGPGKYVTEYQYRDPLFEGRQREFRGFTRARSKRIGDANSPSDYTETAFLLGECEDETPSNGVDDCSLSERWRDNPREALKGLPIFTEKYDERGVYLSTDSSTYRLRQLFVGLDGRVVRQAFESAKKTVLYDTAAGPQTGATLSAATSVELETTNPGTSWHPVADQLEHPGQAPTPLSSVTVTRSSQVPLRASTGAAVLRSASEVDFFGNKLVGYDFGCQGGSACPTNDVGLVADETIVHVTDALSVAGDEGGWLWRTTQSWVTGSVHQDQRSYTATAYDFFGNPTTTNVELHGVVALDRFNAVPAQGTAPLPGTASSNHTFTASTNHYNSLGLLTQEEGALGRCRDVSYGSDYYAEFATGETIHTSGGCAGTGIALSTAAMYDRGFGAPTTVVDMQNQTTSVRYDSFARLSQLTRPAPPECVHTVAGASLILPSLKVSYALPSVSNGLKYSVIHTQTQDGASCSDDSYLESYSYVDGLGRTRAGLSEADPSANDGGSYILSDVQVFDAKSAVSRKYIQSFTNSDPAQFPLLSVPSSGYGRQRYDAFGRQVQTFDLDGTVTLQSVYHALSSDLSDAADLENGPHQGSYASTRSDGHGRTIATTERAHVNGALEAREVRTKYLPTGEPEVITRVRVGKSDPPVVRWMRYDSLGHLVLNVDPHTSQNFDADPSTSAVPSSTGLKAWRYAYDDAGDLVGTSDARGCGENFAYDSAGRILTEDYSPCGQQGPYSPPTWNAANDFGPSGYEVIYLYDTAPAQPFPFPTWRVARPTGYASAGTSDYLRGRLVATWSTGKTQWNSYDARGRVIQTAVLPALAFNQGSRLPSASMLYQRYGRRFYYRDFKYDAADREVSATTGSTVSELQGTPESTGAPSSAVMTDYSQRGTVKKVRSTYGDLVTGITRTADGLVTRIVYGDTAGTATDSDYDARRRLRDVQTYRSQSFWNSPPTNYTPVPGTTGPPSTLQLVLQDQQLSYDVVGNPTEIRDYRAPEEWPAGAKPVSEKVQYDDLYRAIRIDYQTAGGTDAWTSPFASELSGQSDPRRPAPAAHVAFASRPLYQTFSYDWLGNTQSSDDDAHGFYDRSLGTITNDVAGGRPYQLKSASNGAGPVTTRSGSTDVLYDAMGNISRINLKRNGPCLPAGSPCSSRWDLQYDEVGRLGRIYRADLAAAALPPVANDLGSVPRRDLEFFYDENDERIVKMSTDINNDVSTTIYPFETLELRGTAIDPSFIPAGYYESALNADNEVPYLVAHGVRLARVDYEPATKGEPHVGTTSAARQHVLFELGDQLGSTDIVIDKATSELVEASTYQGYGAKESDYRPARWKGYRDDYGFTGKEEDAEFGIVYFGKRFYSPALNRWITADPLGVHSPGKADLNIYAYIKGTILKATDPLGLEEDYQTQQSFEADQTSASTGLASDTSGNTEVPTPMVDPRNASADAKGGKSCCDDCNRDPVESLRSPDRRSVNSATQASGGDAVSISAGGASATNPSAGTGITTPNVPANSDVWIDHGDSRGIRTRDDSKYGNVTAIELNGAGLGINGGLQLGWVSDARQGWGITAGASKGMSATWGGETIKVVGEPVPASPLKLSVSAGISSQVYWSTYETYNNATQYSADVAAGTIAGHVRAFVPSDPKSGLPAGTPVGLGTYLGAGLGASWSVNRSTSSSVTIFFGDFSNFSF